MKNRKNSLLTALIAVLGLLFFSAAIYAQGYWNHDNNYDRNWWNSNVPGQYQLSNDQVNKLNELRLEYDGKILPLQNELRSLRTEMRSYTNRTDFDPNKIQDYRKQIRDIEDQIADFQLNYRKDMNDFLSDNQKTYYNNPSYGWWDNFYGRCGWDYGDRYYNNNYYNGRQYRYRGHTHGYGCGHGDCW